MHWKKLLKDFMQWQPNEKSELLILFRSFKIPGIKEALRPQIHVMERIMWVIMVLLCLLTAMRSIITMYIVLSAAPIVFTLQTVPIHASQIPFPTVVFGKRTNYEEKQLKSLRPLIRNAQAKGEAKLSNTTLSEENVYDMGYLMNHLCQSSDPKFKWYGVTQTTSLSGSLTSKSTIYDGNPSSNFNDQMIAFVADGIPKCSSIVKRCSFNGIPIPCEDHIVDIQTDAGAACAFNKPSDIVVKRNHGLYFKLNDNPEDKEIDNAWENFNWDDHMLNLRPINPTCQKGIKATPIIQNVGGQKYGLSIILEMDKEAVECLQNSGDGFILQLLGPFDEPLLSNNGMFIPLNHEVLIAIDPKITFSNENIREYSKELRGCIFSDEMSLKYFKHYTQSNCQREIIANHTFDACKCGMVTFPNDNGTVICSTPEQVQCAREAEIKTDNLTSLCLPGCTDVRYDYKITYHPYSPLSPPDLITENTEQGKWTSILHVFMEKDYFIALYRDKKKSVEEVLADIGGTLGLTNGLSYIDIIRIVKEMIFYIVSIIITRILRNFFSRWAPMSTPTSTPPSSPLFSRRMSLPPPIPIGPLSPPLTPSRSSSSMSIRSVSPLPSPKRPQSLIPIRQPPSRSNTPPSPISIKSFSSPLLSPSRPISPPSQIPILIRSLSSPPSTPRPISPPSPMSPLPTSSRATYLLPLSFRACSAPDRSSRSNIPSSIPILIRSHSSKTLISSAFRSDSPFAMSQRSLSPDATTSQQPNVSISTEVTCLIPPFSLIPTQRHSERRPTPPESQSGPSQSTLPEIFERSNFHASSSESDYDSAIDDILQSERRTSKSVPHFPHPPKNPHLSIAIDSEISDSDCDDILQK